MTRKPTVETVKLTDPTTQNMARMMTKGPRFFLVKNSQKYEKATGMEPPTLRGGEGRGGLIEQ